VPYSQNRQLCGFFAQFSFLSSNGQAVEHLFHHANNGKVNRQVRRSKRARSCVCARVYIGECVLPFV